MFPIAMIGLVVGCRTGLTVEDFDRTSGEPDTGHSGTDASTLDTGAPATDASTPTTSTCPTDLPKNGSDCRIVGAVCTYSRGKYGPCSDVGSNDQLAYRCESTGWLEIAHCIDRTSCPFVAPHDGEPCTQEGLDCFYDDSKACTRGAIMQCSGGRFLSVNRCSTASRGECPLQPTLKDDRRLVIDGGEFPVASIGAAIAGTQLMIGALVRPAPHQAGHRFLAQTAVPDMPTHFTAGSDSFFMGEVIGAPQLDFFRDRFVFAYPISDEADAVPGLITQVVPLDGSKVSGARVDGDGIEANGLAIGDEKGGFLTFRATAKDRPTLHEAFGLPLGLDGMATGARARLADEFTTLVPGPPVKHAYAHVARWNGGYVFVAPVPASGDLFDNSGVGIWFAPFGATTLDEKPKTVVPIGDQDVSLVALFDGSAVIAYETDSSPSAGIAFHLTRIMPDGSQKPLPPEMVETRGGKPVLPSLVARDDGFALAWIAAIAAPDDGETLTMHIALRTRDGLGAPPGALTWPIVGGTSEELPALIYAPVDDTLHVLWTQGSRSRVFRERIMCPPFGLD